MCHNTSNSGKMFQKVRTFFLLPVFSIYIIWRSLLFMEGEEVCNQKNIELLFVSSIS